MCQILPYNRGWKTGHVRISDGQKWFEFCMFLDEMAAIFLVFQWFRFRLARTIAVAIAQSFKIQTIQIPNFKKFRFQMYSSHYCNSSQ